MDKTAEFFETLAQRRHNPLLEKAHGTVRFDISKGQRTEHYLVTIDKGDISVARSTASAQCVISADRMLFDDIVTGERNAMAAMLQGSLHIEGDPQMAVLIQRLFTGSTYEQHPQAETHGRTPI